MKKLIIITIVSILISCNQSELKNESPKFHENEKESVVYMTSNNKSENVTHDPNDSWLTFKPAFPNLL